LLGKKVFILLSYIKMLLVELFNTYLI
jgi:hypothetical protein